MSTIEDSLPGRLVLYGGLRYFDEVCADAGRVRQPIPGRTAMTGPNPDIKHPIPMHTRVGFLKALV
ncbi:hypothetical protein LB579_19585, partial [Mesorhizobium sp. BR1-1-7]|nr:hypothetical protein [Mesorhizobium sp. BR1-1-7]